MKNKKNKLILDIILFCMMLPILLSCSKDLGFMTEKEKKIPLNTLSFLDEEFKESTSWSNEKKLNSFSKTKIYPSSSIRKKQKIRGDILLLNKAKISFKKKNFKSSIKNLQTLEKEFPNSDILNESRFRLALAYLEIGNKRKAYTKLEENIKKEQVPSEKAIYLSYLGRIYESENKLYKSLTYYAKALSISQNTEDNNLLSSKLVNLSEKIDPSHKLVTLTNIFRKKNAGPYFRIALIRKSIRGKKLKTALASARIFIEEYPKHKYFNEISALEQNIKKNLSNKLLKLGVLLPLSGKNGKEGEQVYRGIQMALSHLLEIRPDLQVELSVQNIKSTEEESKLAKKYTYEIINSSNTIALIGPLFSPAAKDISRISEEKRIPLIIPYAPNFKMDKEKKWVFRNTLNNEMQNRAIFNFAINRLRLRRFALVHGRNKYQNLMKEKYQKIISEFGGIFTKIVSFPMTANDFQSEMLSLGGLSDSQLRAKFPRLSRKSNFRVPLKFESILISAKAEKIILIVPELPFYNIKGILLLGNRNWNNPIIAKHTGSYIKNAFFVDGFLHSSKKGIVKRFVADYEKLYSKKPGLLEALGYDSAKLIFSAIAKGKRRKQDIQKYLRNLKEFQGVTGRIKGIKNNDFIRELYLLKFRKGIIQEVDMIFP